jgi:hypothetical protein
MSMSAEAPNEYSKPTSTLDLNPTEILIVWSFRRWASGLRQNDGAHWKLIWAEFGRLFGPRDLNKALTEFITIMRMIQAHARRPMRHHQPCCPCLAPDEVMLLCLVGACQSGQTYLAQRLANWMVKPEGVTKLVQAGENLSDHMTEHALRLPVRTKPIDEKGDPDLTGRDTPELDQFNPTVH